MPNISLKFLITINLLILKYFYTGVIYYEAKAVALNMVIS